MEHTKMKTLRELINLIEVTQSGADGEEVVVTPPEEVVVTPPNNNTAPPPPPPPPKKTWAKGVLGRGMRDPGLTGPIRTLQNQLGATEDGAFGPETETAVKQLQAKLKVSPDGAYGPVTKKAHDAFLASAPNPNTISRTDYEDNVDRDDAELGKAMTAMAAPAAPAAPAPVAPPNPYADNPKQAAMYAAMSPADQAWATKGGGKPDLEDPYIAARAPNKFAAVNSTTSTGNPVLNPLTKTTQTQESTNFQPDELNRIVSLIHYR
jgi:peptidoglycan hydrolase-like protein with peptidoglycan-binding domain